MVDEVLVLGSFVADVAFRTPRLPAWGETLMGESFALGPGGKGSNQAIAAARAGAQVRMMSKLGDDAFGRMARELWHEAGIDDSLTGVSETATGAAAILIDQAKGENAIIISPGACFTLTAEDVERQAAAIQRAKILLVQLELPLETVERGLQIARAAGVMTILNPAPAPAGSLPDSMLALADFVIPNETEAALLTGMPVESVADVEKAAAALRERGARHVLVTLGSRGSLLCLEGEESRLIPAFSAGAVLDTTGAGDCFCGAFAAALCEGMVPGEAARFGSAAAAISVTRAGTAGSMPMRSEIETLLRG